MSFFRSYDHFIDGAPRKNLGEGVIARHSPAHGGHLADYVAGDQRDVDVAVAAARSAFVGNWGNSTGEERAAILSRFADLLEANVEKLAAIVAEEVGKPIRFARGEIMAS